MLSGMPIGEGEVSNLPSALWIASEFCWPLALALLGPL